MLCHAKSLKREALKPGGARAEVCVRLLNAESSSTSRKRWTIGAAGEDIVVEIPESGSLDARTIRTIQHVIGLAVRVEIGRSYQSIAAYNARPECATDERGTG